MIQQETPTTPMRTTYVDWHDFEAAVAPSAMSTASSRAVATRPRKRVIKQVDQQVSTLRHNVQDTARAILHWVSGVLAHDDGLQLNDVLNRCLRPGPNVQKLNYAALARMIQQSENVTLSPKSIQTAIRHLRKQTAAQETTTESVSSQKTNPPKTNPFDDLYDQLQQAQPQVNNNTLCANTPQRQKMALSILKAVRCAAGNLIACDFGQGISPSVDAQQLQDQFLDFVRQHVCTESQTQKMPTQQNVHHFMVSLSDHDATAQTDMAVVVTGSQVILDLLGKDSLASILAQLNVLMAGRSWLTSAMYIKHLMRLAASAKSLQHDGPTKLLLSRARRLDQAQRLPSAVRVSSYCLANAASHLLQRLFFNQCDAPKDTLALAKCCLDQMADSDSGFALLHTHQLVYAMVHQQVTNNPSETSQAFSTLLHQLGPTKTSERLALLAKYDNCTQLVHAVSKQAAKVYPQLLHQQIIS